MLVCFSLGAISALAVCGQIETEVEIERNSGFAASETSDGQTFRRQTD